MVGATIGISLLSHRDMPRDFAQYATAGRFYYDRASNLLAYHAVMAAICQRLPIPLCELLTLANRLEAELKQNLPDLKTLF
jgi:hypothetical protein